MSDEQNEGNVSVTSEAVLHAAEAQVAEMARVERAEQVDHAMRRMDELSEELKNLQKFVSGISAVGHAGHAEPVAREGGVAYPLPSAASRVGAVSAARAGWGGAAAHLQMRPCSPLRGGRWRGTLPRRPP